MSEQEMKSGGAGGSSVVLVEQSAASRHKQPFRPIDIQNEASHDSQNKRNKAPAVPSVAEDLKQSPEDRDRKENEHAISSEKHKHSFAKKLSSNKRRSPSPETITLAPLEVDTMKASITPLQPIPAQVPSGLDLPTKQPSAKKEDDESITEEIAGSRTPDVAKDSDEWSDEEEAGGLPRSESRASRVSRAVRQLLCCGVRYNAPSEHQMSPRYDGI